MCDTHVEKRRGRVQEAIRLGLGSFDPESAPASRAERIMRKIAACRTPEMGSRVVRCGDCGYTDEIHLSCRDRHCPACGAYKREKWILEQQARTLTASGYFATFTNPHTIAVWALGNQKLIYGILFKAAWESLLECGRRQLGGDVGAVAVLHTWTQDLRPHPHIHMVVTDGALREDGSWSEPGEKYLVPVGVLMRLYRKAVTDAIADAYRAGEFVVPEGTPGYGTPKKFWDELAKMSPKKWSVHIEAPKTKGGNAFHYLGSYIHRVAISDARMEKVSAGEVAFACSRGGPGEEGGGRTVRLTPKEFNRRFSWHILPKGFTKVRHHGICSPQLGQKKKEMLAKLNLKRPRRVVDGPDAPTKDQVFERMRYDPRLCPKCGTKGVRPFGARPSYLRARARDGPSATSPKK
jgi:hypothetical protein